MCPNVVSKKYLNIWKLIYFTISPLCRAMVSIDKILNLSVGEKYVPAVRIMSSKTRVYGMVSFTASTLTSKRQDRPPHERSLLNSSVHRSLPGTTRTPIAVQRVGGGGYMYYSFKSHRHNTLPLSPCISHLSYYYGTVLLLLYFNVPLLLSLVENMLSSVNYFC